MGYRILYEKGCEKTKIPDKLPSNRKKIVKWSLIALSVILIVLVSQIRSLRQLILPGKGAVTEAALVDLVESIQTGEPLGEAVTAFCRRIIENAD